MGTLNTDFFDRHHELHESWLQELHDNPELGFEEIKTADILRRILNERCGTFKVSSKTLFPTVPTAILAVFEPRTEDERLKPILLRGDMDALPMSGPSDNAEIVGTSLMEGCYTPGPIINHKHAGKTAKDSRTENVPVCHHGCGHDGHTAMMLITAHWIQENQNKVHRKVVIFFQPAEETRRPSDNCSGALAVIQEGLFDIHPDIHAVYGVHGAPAMPIGTFVTGKSAMMASSGRFSIEIEGSGGHAANPGREQTEPLLAASAIVTCGQTIISRRFEPSKVGVLAFCVVDGQGSTAGNVCPKKVEIRGSIRAFTDEDWNYISEEIERISQKIGQAYMCQVTYLPNKGYPVTMNSPLAGDISKRAAEAAVYGTDLKVYNVGYGNGEVPPATGSEDFSYLLMRRPGAFAFIGIGTNITTMHTADVKFPAEALKFGGRYFREIVCGQNCEDEVPII